MFAAARLLDIASEAIAEETSEPWPASAGSFPRAFPDFRVTVSEGILHMSYGSPDDPILQLEPIEIESVLVRNG